MAQLFQYLLLGGCIVAGLGCLAIVVGLVRDWIREFRS
jgi:hypothetical protein